MMGSWPAVLIALMLVLSGCDGAQRALPNAQTPTAAARKTDPEAVVNVYSWPDYIAPDTVRNFEQETGIHVNYSTYDNDEELETKMLMGATPYDVVIPSGPFFARLLKAAMYHKLDKSELPNLKNLDPAIMARLAMYDPGNLHAVPYLWNTTGIAYNVDMVSRRLGTMPLDSWGVLFDPANAAKLADCGIALVESPIEVTASANMYLGQDPHQLAPQELADAVALMKKIRPYIRYTSATRLTDDLAGGKLCLAITWSGDAVAANERARAAGNGVRVAYVIPKEGALISVDMMSIPADAPHPHNAARWINYLMRADVMAAITNQTRYPSGNAAAFALVRPEVKSDPSTYPDAATQARLTDSISVTPEYSLLVNREWARFRANYR